MAKFTKTEIAATARKCAHYSDIRSTGMASSIRRCIVEELTGQDNPRLSRDDERSIGRAAESAHQANRRRAGQPAMNPHGRSGRAWPDPSLRGPRRARRRRKR
jgi:hypothetical protein